VFRRILVANRGEIALRILRSCRELGVQTVAIHSEADRDAPWLAEADESICVGEARADRSYLDADAILQAAEQTESRAIHPGYGFLAENPLFAARCEQQGISFIGPPAKAIRLMGDKAQAKRTISRAGLPTIPGSDGPVPDVEQARRLADRFGYPVLLKAVAGGGGKGMRRCDSEKDLRRAFDQASLEAEKAFGNASLYLEKFVDGGRHIEFQILCDSYGGAIHLGERECSIQRQHQKLVEESPSPAVDAATRDELGRRVARAAAAVGYRNAGTVEFLRGPDGDFYFMEMNTRLQVEHPVTEMVTGVDLVAEQLSIAANRPLGIVQRDVALTGCAMEFRINAEDPDNDFRPDPGRIESFSPPAAGIDGVSVRWDSAIRAGYRIPPHYDSMVGKLIVHAANRETLFRGAAGALDSMRVDGVRTTIGLHRRLLDHPEFRQGRYDINFLPRSGLLDTAREGS
jgi:acetyl-CoA carboxylase biotin carboxylase subunit